MGEGLKFWKKKEPEAIEDSVTDKDFQAVTQELDDAVSRERLKEDPNAAETVGSAVGWAAADSLYLAHRNDPGVPYETRTEVARIFTEAATETAKNPAGSYAKEVNAKYYEELVHAIDPEMSREAMAAAVEDGGFYAVRRILAQMLGRSPEEEVATRKSPDDTKAFLKEMLDEEERKTGTKDYFYKLVDTIAAPKRELSAQELRSLEMGYRLAAGTWGGAQPIKGLTEGTPEKPSLRGNSKTQPNFRAFDDMVRTIHLRGGLDRAAFEVLKDSEQLKRFLELVRGGGN